MNSKEQDFQEYLEKDSIKIDLVDMMGERYGFTRQDLLEIITAFLNKDITIVEIGQFLEEEHDFSKEKQLELINQLFDFIIFPFYEYRIELMDRL